MTDASTPNVERVLSRKQRRRRRLLALTTVVLGFLAALGVGEMALRVMDREPRRFEYDATVGYINRSNAEFTFNSMKVRTGNDGRIASPVVGTSPAPDLVVVGDSYAAGQAASWPGGCVEVATEILARERPGYTTVNLGTSGYGTDQCLLRLREFLPARPRTVVYVMCDNDLHDNFDHFHFGLFKPRFELREGGLMLAEHASAVNWLVLNSKVVGLVAKQFVDPASHKTEWTRHSPEERARLGAALVGAMRKESEAVGARFVVVAHWLATQKKPDEDFSLLMDMLRGAGTEVVVLNERVDLAAHYDAARWHWDAEGHRLVGEELARVVAGVGAAP